MTTHEVTIFYAAAGWYSRCIGRCSCGWETEEEGTIREVRKQAAAHVGPDDPPFIRVDVNVLDGSTRTRILD